MKKYFKDSKRCKTCGGLCCKRLPGSCYPEDIEPITFENLQKLFKTGKWCIDSWEDMTQNKYFIRPSIKGYEGKIYDPSWGGECTFLRDTGCSLSIEARPFECRMLEPRIEKCKAHYKGKLDAAKAWKPFSKLLRRSLEYSKKE